MSTANFDVIPEPPYHMVANISKYYSLTADKFILGMTYATIVHCSVTSYYINADSEASI